MRTFIEDYLQNPSQAVANAKSATSHLDADEEMIYAQLASPEFRLYEEIILSRESEDYPAMKNFAAI